MLQKHLAAMALLLMPCVQGASADAIVLKDGSCFKGSINIRTSKEIWVRLHSGETRTISVAEIDHIIEGEEAECPGGTTTALTAEPPVSLDVEISVARGLQPTGREVQVYEDSALRIPAGTIKKMSRTGTIGLLLPATPPHAAGWQAGFVRYDNLNGVYFFSSDAVSDCDAALVEITCRNRSETAISGVLVMLESDPVAAGESLAPGAAITGVSWSYLSGSAAEKYNLQDAREQLEALLTKLSVCVSTDGTTWQRIPAMAHVTDTRRIVAEEVCPKCAGKSGTCSRCKGEGHYVVPTQWGGISNVYRDVNCSNCRGRGQIECRKCKSTGFITKTTVEKAIRPGLAMSAQAAYAVPADVRLWIGQRGAQERRLAAARAEFKDRPSKPGLNRRVVYGERVREPPPGQTIAAPLRRPAVNPLVLTKSSLRDGGWSARFLTAASSKDLTILGDRPFRCTLTCKGKDQYDGPGLGGTQIGYADNVLHIEEVGWEDAWRSFTIVTQLDVLLTHVEGIHTGPDGQMITVTFPLELTEIEKAKIERGFASRELVITIDWEPARAGYEWDKSGGNSIQNAAYLARVLYFRIDAH